MANATPWHRLYKTKQWEALRRQTFIRDLYTCQDCGVIVGLRKRDAHCDHIVPHKGDASLFHDPDNLQTLCERCHNGSKQSEEKTGRKATRFTEDGNVIW